MKIILVIISLLTSFGVTVAWAIWGWGQNEMGFHAWLAMILGIVVTSLVWFGLLGLMFYSSRRGYDEGVTDLSDKDKR